jgi:exopolyphosphatase/pppGpp-phosphohydrolase
MPGADGDAHWAPACAALVAKYGAHAGHAAHVMRLAEHLLEATWQFNWLMPSDRPVLLAAAQLCNIGYLVEPEFHHRHSRYLVTHDTLTGDWSPEMRAEVGLLVLNHRKKNPRGLEALRRTEMKRIRALAALLRLADVLDRDHEQRAAVRFVHETPGRDGILIGVSGVDLRALEPHLRRKGHWATQVWRRDLEVVCDDQRVSVSRHG